MKNLSEILTANPFLLQNEIFEILLVVNEENFIHAVFVHWKIKQKHLLITSVIIIELNCRNLKLVKNLVINNLVLRNRILKYEIM